MSDLPDIVKQKLAALPSKPGVYRYFDKKGELIYVGKAKNLKRRVSSYFNKEQTGKTRVLVSKIADLEYSIVDSESEALLLENTMIKQYKPRYNIMLKDDKTYPWICIKKEPFPRVFLTRRKLNDGSDYFGPYPSVRTAHVLLDLLSQAYKIRSCRTPLTEAGVEKGKYKVCLDYHIHKCNGPCEGLVSKDDYNAMIAEIREIIRGNVQVVLRDLKAQMMDYASRMEFEEAQLIKEKYDLLENYRSRSTVVSATIHNVEVFSYVDDGEAFFVNFMKVVDGAVVQSHSFEMRRRLDETPEELLLLAITELRQQFDHPAEEIIVPMKLDYALDALLTVPQRGDKQKLLDLSRRNAMQYRIDLEKQRTLVDPERHQKRVLNSLKEALQLNEIPEVIECFDNSNFQGDYAVAGMVQFVKGKPNKSAYRHFNIKTVEGPDDYASMKEVVRRRYSRLIEEGKPLPNLIITDGGKGQMEVVRQVVEDELQINIPIAGLAKDDRHRTNELLFGFPPRVVGLKPNSEVFRLLTHIQDEVHRFAITFHRKKFEKGFMHSELADIKGVGKKTAEKLLLELKSVKGIKEASLERLTEIVGSAKALIVYNHFAVETH
ncbi:MAG: excinuclease ABC subunit UvrC [Bacteroidales bacterium]|nr:excinuclease ABC subunit UvrC [Bacteroidales bacterium]